MKKKILFLSLSIFMVLGIALCATIAINKNQDKVDEIDDTLLVSVNNDSNIIKLSKERIKRLANNNSSYVVNATITSADIANNKLTWSLKWKDGTTTNILNYVTMSISSDTLSVTLIQKAQFTQQMILTATSTVNTSVSASCTLDCYKRFSELNITELKYTLDGGTTLTSATIDNVNKKITYAIGDSQNLSKDMFSLISGIQFTPSVGTVNVNYQYDLKFKLSDDAIGYLESCNLDYDYLSNFKSIDFDDFTCSGEINKGYHYNLWELFDISSEAQFNELMNALSGDVFSGYDNWFELEISVKGTVNGETVNMSTTYELCGFNATYYKNLFSQMSVSLSTSGYIF